MTTSSIPATLFHWLDTHARVVRMFVLPVVVVFMAGVYWLVYATGGIKYVYSHSMYLAILLGGFVYGVTGGALLGVLAGVVLGPFMPIDVITGEPQQTANWMYRTGFFVLIGAFSGAASDCVRSYVSRLNWATRHDESLGLPNSVALIEALIDVSRITEREAAPGALVTVHLENSNELSTVFGFGVVDEILRQMAARLTDIDPAKPVAYRLDSDKLAVVMHGIDDTQVEGILAELSKRFREPFTVNDVRLHGDVRMGCVKYARIKGEPASYLQNAQAALATASIKGVESAVFAPRISSDSQFSLQHLGDLQEALVNRSLSLNYQPKVDMHSGRVLGVEALMRWQHPVHGNIPPASFIPRAELSTLIEPLTDFALNSALRQMQIWREQGTTLSIAVNISARNLLQPNFAEQLREMLEQYRIGPDMLELEVTESALMIDFEAALGTLDRLAAMGIILSIDDFGTGYSSLQYLSKLPISLIKIDQAFVRNLPGDTGARHIVEAAVKLAHKLNLNVLAEGVENPQAYDFLRKIGCNLAQGYYIARPVAVAQFEEWYRNNGGAFAHFEKGDPEGYKLNVSDAGLGDAVRSMRPRQLRSGTPL